MGIGNWRRGREIHPTAMKLFIISYLAVPILAVLYHRFVANLRNSFRRFQSLVGKRVARGESQTEGIEADTKGFERG